MLKPDLSQDSLYYKLLSHQFVMAVLQNLSPLHSILSSKLAEKISGDEGSVDIKTRTRIILNQIHSADIRLSAELHYHNEVFQYMSNLTHAVERLEMTPAYLGRFSRSKTYEKHGITLHRWIQYHYSNYLVTAVSIYDTALLLTNAVFALGVKPRECRNKTVAKNPRVSQTGVSDALNNLDNITEGFRDPRHLFVHRNIIPDLDFLDELEGLQFIEEASASLDTELEPLIHPRIVELLYRSERRKLVKTIQQETEKIADGVYGLYTELAPIYSQFTILLKDGMLIEEIGK